MKTSLAQRLPADLEECITAFHQNLYYLRRSEDLDEELIGNMDETPAYFDVVPGHTCPLIKSIEKVSSSELLAVRRDP